AQNTLSNPPAWSMVRNTAHGPGNNHVSYQHRHRCDPGGFVDSPLAPAGPATDDALLDHGGVGDDRCGCAVCPASGSAALVFPAGPDTAGHGRALRPLPGSTADGRPAPPLARPRGGVAAPRGGTGGFSPGGP